jgi:excisionase family DNA binding protein
MTKRRSPGARRRIDDGDEGAGPELISVHRAAKRLGFSDGTVRRFVLNGDLPGVRLGNRWYVRNLSAFLDAVQTKPAPASPREALETRRAIERSREEEMRALGIDPAHHPFL